MRPTRVRSSTTVSGPSSAAIRARTSARSRVSSWARAEFATRTNSVVSVSRSGHGARAEGRAHHAREAVEHPELARAARAAEAREHLAHQIGAADGGGAGGTPRAGDARPAGGRTSVSERRTARPENSDRVVGIATVNAGR